MSSQFSVGSAAMTAGTAPGARSQSRCVIAASCGNAGHGHLRKVDRPFERARTTDPIGP